MKICIPINESDINLLSTRYAESAQHADVIEIWLDSLSVADLPSAIMQSSKPILYVCKGAEEHGSFSGLESDRIQKLIDVLSYKPAYIDVGIHTDPQLIRQLEELKGDTELIISYHNFKKTPSWDELCKIVIQSIKLGADVIKIATQVNDAMSDSIHLLRTIEMIHGIGKKAIITGMGTHGKIIRAIAPLLGTEFTYAPLNQKNATAPGQISYNDLRTIWDILKK